MDAIVQSRCIDRLLMRRMAKLCVGTKSIEIFKEEEMSLNIRTLMRGLSSLVLIAQTALGRL
jgi:hypothetical protein